MLGAQEPSHEVGVDLHLGRGDRGAHRVSLDIRAARVSIPAEPRQGTRQDCDAHGATTSFSAAAAVHYGDPITTDRHRRYR